MINFIKQHIRWIVVGLTLIASVYAFYQLLLPLDVFLWDESHHAFYGMQIYDDLKAGDWGQFWAHTNNQALWMPVHSWLDGIFLYLFGFSYAAARSTSLFLFFWCSLLVFLIANELSREKGWLIGLVSVLLFLTSPIILHLATVNMQEMLGMFALLLLVYFMTKYLAVEKPWKYLVIGLLIGFAYWTKSNHAVQLIFGLGLFQFSLLWDIYRPVTPPPAQPEQNKKAYKKKVKEKPKSNPLLDWVWNNVLIAAGFLPLFILWWATPPFDRKYALGFAARTDMSVSPFFRRTNIMERVFFYLQSLVSSHTFSLWLGIGFIIALGIAFYYFKDKRHRLLLLMFMANLIMLSPLGNLQERYLSITAPLVFILLAYYVVVFMGRVRTIKMNKTIRTASLVLAAFIGLNIVSDALSLTRYTKEVANRSILSFIYKENLNQFDPPFMFGLIKRPRFTYPLEQIKKYPDFKSHPRTTFQEILDYFCATIGPGRSIATFISYAQISPYVIYWHFHDWGAPALSANDIPYTPQYFWAAEYFLELQPATDSPYAIEWIDKSWNKYGPILLGRGYVKLVARKEFADLGLTAYVFKREKPIQ